MGRFLAVRADERSYSACEQEEAIHHSAWVGLSLHEN